MTSCSGFDSLPSSALRGPKNLEFIDLSATKIFSVNGNEEMKPNDSNESPLAHIKVLNLSNSLNVIDGMEILGLAQMQKLGK